MNKSHHISETKKGKYSQLLKLEGISILLKQQTVKMSDSRIRKTLGMMAWRKTGPVEGVSQVPFPILVFYGEYLNQFFAVPKNSLG